MVNEEAADLLVDGDAEEVLNEVADNVDGILALLEDVKGSSTSDARLNATITALKHTRSVLDPVLERL